MFIPALISVVTKPLPDGSNADLLLFSMEKSPSEKLLQSSEYEAWRHIILKLEVPILICSQFNLVIEHPYSLLSLFYDQIFSRDLDYESFNEFASFNDFEIDTRDHLSNSIRNIVIHHSDFFTSTTANSGASEVSTDLLKSNNNICSVSDNDKYSFFLFLVWNMANSCFRVPACIIYRSVDMAIACFLAPLILITNNSTNPKKPSKEFLINLLINELMFQASATIKNSDHGADNTSSESSVVDVTESSYKINVGNEKMSNSFINIYKDGIISSASKDDILSIVDWIFFVYYNDEKIKIDQQYHYHKHLLHRQQKLALQQQQQHQLQQKQQDNIQSQKAHNHSSMSNKNSQHPASINDQSQSLTLVNNLIPPPKSVNVSAYDQNSQFDSAVNYPRKELNPDTNSISSSSPMSMSSE
ncbi:hypothetical protein AYI70_g1362 [Smittium culicis]|uniref:Uncharacterized protein n=1 Tax=Smittium culicis TaxID=133412 RepID=A0A1R1YCX2_9FUNG|nr:hypothetical protein AYI70_g1362 [Smittium culicis]